MTRPKAEPSENRPTLFPKSRRVMGFLVCERCKRVVSYQGTEDESLDPWPKHRCGLDIRSFDRFTTEDPFRLPLGAGATTESLNDPVDPGSMAS